MEKTLDYSKILKVLESADQAFTSKRGCGVHFTEFDEHLKSTVTKYNKSHGTSFDPFEALHQYLELSESKPQPVVLEEIELNVDDLDVGTTNNATLH